MLDGLMQAIQFSVGLQVVGRCPNVSHARYPDRLFEVLGDELRSVIGNNSGGSLGEFLPGPLQNDFHIFFSHCLAQFPVNDVAATAVQYAAQVVKSAADIDL